MMSDAVLDAVFDVIKARQGADAQTSYVASLYDKGTEKIAEKVGEEAIEVVIEAVKRDGAGLALESADLLFHLMVLWADQGVDPADVYRILSDRMGVSGLDEKAGRS